MSRPFVKFWEVADLKDAFMAPLRGRGFARGCEMFEAASCLTCHKMEGRGGQVDVSLAESGTEYQGLELLRQIIEPSSTIKEKHRLYCFDLDDESRYFGTIVEQDEESVTIVESVNAPKETIWFERKEIVKRTPLEASAMPTGLLLTLTREEILDLAAYVAANGDESDAAFAR